MAVKTVTKDSGYSIDIKYPGPRNTHHMEVDNIDEVVEELRDRLKDAEKHSRDGYRITITYWEDEV